MKDSTKLTIALGLIAAGLMWPKLKESFVVDNDKTFGNAEVVNVIFEKVDEPTEEMKTLASGLSDLVVGEDAGVDKVRLAQFYAQLSHVVRKEPDFLKTTGQFREYNSTSGQINFAGIAMKGKYSGLGEAVDNVISEAIGLDNVSLDSAKRNRLADTLAAISWEFWHEQ